MKPTRNAGSPVASRTSGLRRRKGVLILLVLAIGGCFAVNPYLRGDGNGYYAYVRSPVIDGDLKFENEFLRGDPAFRRAIDGDGQGTQPIAANLVRDGGYVHNQWSPGVAIIWAPFFVVAHVGVLAARGAGSSLAADGFSLPYRFACGLATYLAILAGLVIAARTARRHAGVRPEAAVAGALAILGATSLLIYTWLLPFWSLGPASLPGALLVAHWARGPARTAQAWGVQGLLVGLAVLTHPLGIAWAALLAVGWIVDDHSALARVRALAAAGVGLALGLLPQFIVRGVVDGNPFDSGYPAVWNFANPPIAQELFTGDHALIVWTPIVALAVAGLVVAVRGARTRRLGIGLLAVVALLTYLAAAYLNYEASSYGNRFFLHATPAFVIGLSVGVDRLWDRRRNLVVGVLLAATAWNVLLGFQWAWAMVPKRAKPDWGMTVRNQFTTAPRELARVAVRFITDRDGVIAEAQARDEAQLLEEEAP